MQREFGRSNVGAIFINRQATGGGAGSENFNRAYGVDTALQTSANGKLFAFIAGTTSPEVPVTGRRHGTDISGRLFYTYNKPGWFNYNVGYAGVGDNFNPEVGYQPRTTGYHFGTYRFFLDWQPKKYPYVRRFSPHIFENWYWGLDGNVQTMRGHYHFLEIQPRSGGRWGARIDREQDRPIVPFVINSDPNGERVVIPPGFYSWNYWSLEYFSNPAAPFNFSVVPTWGSFYDGDWTQIAVNLEGRVGDRLTASVGYTQADVDLPYGNFVTKLVPTKLSYSFTPLATLAALVQYNTQTSTRELQHPPGFAQPQRHRPVRGLQRPARHLGRHAVVPRARPRERPARPLVHRQVHAAVRLLSRRAAGRGSRPRVTRCNGRDFDDDGRVS